MILEFLVELFGRLNIPREFVLALVFLIPMVGSIIAFEARYETRMSSAKRKVVCVLIILFWFVVDIMLALIRPHQK